MKLSREEYWDGLPFCSPGALPNPGTEPGSPALQADSLQSESPGNQVGKTKIRQNQEGMVKYQNLKEKNKKPEAKTSLGGFN